MARRSLNKVLLLGNLTRDPVAKYLPSGTMICVFGIATNRTIKKADGTTEELTEFINISATGKLAELCYKLLAKGMLVFVEGELRTRAWETPSGEKRYRTEVRISDMILVDSKGKKGVGSGGVVPEGEEQPPVEEQKAMSDEELDRLLGEVEEEGNKEEEEGEGKDKGENRGEKPEEEGKEQKNR